MSCEVSDDLVGVACCATSLCSDFLVWKEFLRSRNFPLGPLGGEHLDQVLEAGQVRPVLLQVSVCLS